MLRTSKFEDFESKLEVRSLRSQFETLKRPECVWTTELLTSRFDVAVNSIVIIERTDSYESVRTHFPQPAEALWKFSFRMASLEMASLEMAGLNATVLTEFDQDPLSSLRHYRFALKVVSFGSTVSNSICQLACFEVWTAFNALNSNEIVSSRAFHRKRLGTPFFRRFSNAIQPLSKRSRTVQTAFTVLQF